MSAWKDKVFEDWWPLGQAMILVRASLDRTAEAMRAESERLRLLCGRHSEFDWFKFDSIGHLFEKAEPLTGHLYFALPTKCD